VRAVSDAERPLQMIELVARFAHAPTISVPSR
jgi:hypothetical protein